MSSQPSVSVSEQGKGFTLNILRDVSVRIPKISENDLPKIRRAENVPSPNVNPRSLEKRIEGEVDIRTQAQLGINPCNVIKENDGLPPLHAEGRKNAEDMTNNINTFSVNAILPAKTTSDLTDYGLCETYSLTTEDFEENRSENKKLNGISGDLCSDESYMHAEVQPPALKIDRPSKRPSKISSVLTCQIASPDSVEPVVGWSPSPQRNEKTPENAESGWEMAETVIQVKSQSACSNYAKLSNHSINNGNVSPLPAKCQSNLTGDVDYEGHTPSISMNSTESNDSDCVVEYISNDTYVSTEEPVVNTSTTKHALPQLINKYSHKDSRKIRNNRRFQRKHKSNSKKITNERQNLDMGTVHGVANNDNSKIESSDKESISDETSTSENEDEIDVDEMKTLKSKLRRSNRVARPVYDSFTDQQVNISLNLQKSLTLLNHLNRQTL